MTLFYSMIFASIFLMFLSASYAEQGNYLGAVSWLDNLYSSSGTGVVMVVDENLENNPKDLFVQVYSDTDKAGIKIPISLTREGTATFMGLVSFSSTKSTDTLHVTPGDTVTVRYIDDSMPNSETQKTKDTAIIKTGTSVPKDTLSPLKQISSGVSVDKIQCKENLILVSKLSDKKPACVKPLSAIKLTDRHLMVPVSSIDATITIPSGISPDCAKNNSCFVPYITRIDSNAINDGDIDILFINQDSQAHLITTGKILGNVNDGSATTIPDTVGSRIEPNNTGGIITNSLHVGENDYFCIMHPWMAGKIIVS